MKQLHDRLGDARDFFSAQLSGFQRQHRHQPHDISDGPLREWLWREWTNTRDTATRELFAAHGAIVRLQARQLQAALEVAGPPGRDAAVQTRFEHAMQMPRLSSGEEVRLARRAVEDRQSCRFLVVEAATARMLADLEGRVHRHVFCGWDKL
ncbi:hypothetical protein QQZ08_003225 [Neonectria magnoliae]|uniref:Uncharacterized protein n=1 Tax=Neonectria magnoliae TaxID=2732573 RepID=A0ABR1IB60_9HYPO